MSIHDQMGEVWVLEVNQNPTNSMNWLNIETLASAVSRNVRLHGNGTTINWVLIGLYASIKAAGAAASVYREVHASERPPEPDV